MNCGGQNQNTQAGTAVADIVVGPTAVWFDYQLSGWGELQFQGTDSMWLALDILDIDGHGVAGNAESAGGGLGCQDGPVVFTRYGFWPEKFEAGSSHSFFLDFSTHDKYFHVNCYYEVTLTMNAV